MPTKTAKSTKLSKFPKTDKRQERLEKIGIDSICAAVMTGASLTAIAGEMDDVPPKILMQWIEGSDSRVAKVKEARVVSSYHFADQALIEIKAAEGKDQISRARELAHHYRWLASKFNRDVFGSHQTIDATLNHNIQFLDALKQHGTTALPLPEVKVEVIVDED